VNNILTLDHPMRRTGQANRNAPGMIDAPHGALSHLGVERRED
jgi:hypothetical protein